MFRITVTLDTEYLTGCVGFSSFLAKIKAFWKYLAYDAIVKTWIMPHQAAECFVMMMFLGDVMFCMYAMFCTKY